MRLIRIAVGHVNTIVGAVRSNVDRAVAVAKEAAADGSTLVVFPEQMIAGYTPEDLVHWRAFVDAQWTELVRFAEETKDLAPAFAVGLTVARGSHVYNAAAFVQAGKILGIPQPHVSDLMRGRARAFSAERLMEFLAALGHDVEIRVRPSRKAHGQVSVVVAA